jgi:hypothetical protein
MGDIKSIASFKKKYYPKTYEDEMANEELDPYDIGNLLAERALDKIKLRAATPP